MYYYSRYMHTANFEINGRGDEGDPAFLSKTALQ